MSQSKSVWTEGLMRNASNIDGSKWEQHIILFSFRFKVLTGILQMSHHCLTASKAVTEKPHSNLILYKW